MISTAKESYRLKLPQISTHSLVNFNEMETSNQILLSISQMINQNINKKPLKPSNMFILLKSVGDVDENIMKNFNLHDDSDVPVSCSQVNISLKNVNHFSIFQDFDDLKIEEKEISQNWISSNQFVKGFNNILINKKSIWE